MVENFVVVIRLVKLQKRVLRAIHGIKNTLNISFIVPSLSFLKSFSIYKNIAIYTGGTNM